MSQKNSLRRILVISVHSSGFLACQAYPINVITFNVFVFFIYFDVFENACACTWEESFNLNLRCRSGAHGIANCAKTPNELPQKHQTKYHKNTKQNATKIPNALQNPQETSIFAASLYSKQYGIPQKDCR